MIGATLGQPKNRTTPEGRPRGRLCCVAWRARVCRLRSWRGAGPRRSESQDEITEREVTVLLADFATVWNELFPAE